MLGPAGFYGKEWFDSFLQHVGPGVVDGVTHHIYNLGAGMYKFSLLGLSSYIRLIPLLVYYISWCLVSKKNIINAGVDKDLINKVQDPYFLSQIAQTFKDVSVAVKEFTPWAGPWVGESGGAYNSGGKDVSHTFANGFWSV